MLSPQLLTLCIDGWCWKLAHILSQGWRIRNKKNLWWEICFSCFLLGKTSKNMIRLRDSTVNLLQTYSWRLFIHNMRTADRGKLTKSSYLQYFALKSWNNDIFANDPPLAYPKHITKLLPTVENHLTCYCEIMKNH